MARFHIDFCFHEKQKAFRRSEARFKNFLAGTRSGKTYAAARVFYENVCQDIQRSGDNRFLHYWVVSPDYPLGKVATRELFEVIPAAHRKRWLQSTRELWLHPNVLIEFKSGENPERLVGVKLHGAWIDEVARCRRAVWVYVRQRLTDYQGWCLFSTTPLGRNWYFEEIYRRGDPNDNLYDSNYFNVHCKTLDNPHIPGDEVEQARKQLPPKYFKRDYEASLDAFQGQVYDDFDRHTHLIPSGSPPPAFERVEAGADFGFTNPATLIVGGITHDGDILVLDEIYQSGLLPAEFIERIQEKARAWNIRTIHADPEDPSYINQINAAGITTLPAHNDVLAGIRQVASLLHAKDASGNPKLRISNRCKNLLSEIATYRWKEDREGRSVDRPAPNQDDHACDALRYLIVGALSRQESFESIYEPDQAGEIFL